MKLISNTAFGKLMFNRVSGQENLDLASYFQLRTEYDEFLETPLSIGQFIPCDADGNVLEEPISNVPKCGCMGICNNPCDEALKIEQYQQAKERLIFEGFEYKELPHDPFSKFEVTNGQITITQKGFDVNSTIENLIIKTDLILTSTAIKSLKRDGNN